MGKTKDRRPEFRPLYLKERLAYRNKTQEQLAEALGISRVQVTRICNGKRQYTQAFLEAAADYLETDAASLIMRDPTPPENIWSIWDRASTGQKRDIERLAEVVLSRDKKIG